VEKISSFPCKLKDLGLTVSTGRVVDFRAKDYLRSTLEENTVPLIYPANFSKGYIEYPQKTKKHQALLQGKQTASLLIPNEHYVLIKRFSSKEEKRRLVAVVHNAEKIDSVWIGLENHLNYIHQNGRGLNLTLAHGLAIYLNSTLVDAFFRLFNGHTQVNATDLGKLNYPTTEQLIYLGIQAGIQVENNFPSQEKIDHLVETQLLKDIKRY
jgi:adenine-specific DNA-methyltransferase